MYILNTHVNRPEKPLGEDLNKFCIVLLYFCPSVHDKESGQRSIYHTALTVRGINNMATQQCEISVIIPCSNINLNPSPNPNPNPNQHFICHVLTLMDWRLISRTENTELLPKFLPNFYATASWAFLLARKGNWLATTCIMNTRNATCVGYTNFKGSDLSDPSVYFLFCAAMIINYM